MKPREPRAAVFSAIHNSETDTASETEDSDTRADKLPEPLVGLCDPDLRGLSLSEMHEKCDVTFNKLKHTLTQEQCVNLELATREQAQSTPWHTHRIGRITSTTFYRACTVVSESATRNLVKSIMHYNERELNCNAIRYGRENEDTARQQYIQLMEKKHQNFEAKQCGLFVQKDRQHLGASPDGVTSCSCCGRGVLEIKCPYKYRDGLTGSQEDTQFCLDSSLKLKKIINITTKSNCTWLSVMFTTVTLLFGQSVQL